MFLKEKKNSPEYAINRDRNICKSFFSIYHRGFIKNLRMDLDDYKRVHAGVLTEEHKLFEKTYLEDNVVNYDLIEEKIIEHRDNVGSNVHQDFIELSINYYVTKVLVEYYGALMLTISYIKSSAALKLMLNNVKSGRFLPVFGGKNKIIEFYDKLKKMPLSNAREIIFALDTNPSLHDCLIDSFQAGNKGKFVEIIGSNNIKINDWSSLVNITNFLWHFTQSPLKAIKSVINNDEDFGDFSGFEDVFKSDASSALRREMKELELSDVISFLHYFQNKIIPLIRTLSVNECHEFKLALYNEDFEQESTSLLERLIVPSYRLQTEKTNRIAKLLSPYNASSGKDNNEEILFTFIGISEKIKLQTEMNGFAYHLYKSNQFNWGDKQFNKDFVCFIHDIFECEINVSRFYPEDEVKKYRAYIYPPYLEYLDECIAMEENYKEFEENNVSTFQNLNVEENISLSNKASFPLEFPKIFSPSNNQTKVLQSLCKRLYNYLDPGITEKHFIYLLGAKVANVNNANECEKINWRSDLASLQYFISKLYFKENSKNYGIWSKAENVFLLKGESLLNKLKNNASANIKKYDGSDIDQIIDEILKEFR